MHCIQEKWYRFYNNVKSAHDVTLLPSVYVLVNFLKVPQISQKSLFVTNWPPSLLRLKLDVKLYSFHSLTLMIIKRKMEKMPQLIPCRKHFWKTKQNTESSSVLPEVTVSRWSGLDLFLCHLSQQTLSLVTTSAEVSMLLPAMITRVRLCTVY